jgi:hypothetical protein
MNAVRERFARHVESAKTRLAAIHPNAVIVMAVVLLIAIAVLNLAKLPMLAWGIGKMLIYAFVGDWIDRKIFADDQPKDLQGIAEGTAWKRKTMIVSASILASAFLP